MPVGVEIGMHFASFWNNRNKNNNNYFDILKK